MVVTTLQQQARALGDPTRHGVFRYIADADGPVDIAAAPADIVYATSSGLIRKVPKKPL